MSELDDADLLDRFVEALAKGEASDPERWAEAEGVTLDDELRGALELLVSLQGAAESVQLDAGLGGGAASLPETLDAPADGSSGAAPPRRTLGSQPEPSHFHFLLVTIDSSD